MVNAILAHNDLWASVCLRVLRAKELGVPEDVAVIGYLNHYLADWTDPSSERPRPNQRKKA